MKTLLSGLVLALALITPARSQVVTAAYDYVIQKTGRNNTTNDWSNSYRKFTVKEGESLLISGARYGNGRDNPSLSISVSLLGGPLGEWQSGLGEIPGPAEVVIGWRKEIVERNQIPEVDVGTIFDVIRVRVYGFPYPPNKTIILPAGSKGGSLELEMSTDLVSWTPSLPGTYSTPTNNLFFRLYLKSVP